MNGFGSVSDALELLVGQRAVEPRWATVLEDAGVGARSRGSRWRPFLVTAAAAGLLAAAAFAAGLGDRFSSWLSGNPGKPAPAREQQGFDARNRLAYASFPEGTKLRLLSRTRAGGRSFDLLGFKNGDAYCLRLVRTDLPQGVGRNQCLRAAELRGRAALVADDVYFTVGEPAQRVTGVFGFASDGVATVRVTRQRGNARVRVENNVFVSLRGQAAGTVQHHLLPNPVLAVAAVLATGQLRSVPYLVEGSGLIGNGKRPSVPSYFGGRGTTSSIGPTRVAAPIGKPTIGWLTRHERRGRPLPPQRWLKASFGRVIQPDSDDPVRVGVAIASSYGLGGLRGPHVGGICIVDFQPLQRASAGGGCTPNPFADGPLMLGSWINSPIAHFNGLAADGIVRVTAYLATGRAVEAALRDNVFSVAVPAADLGGKLVGYDARGRVAAIRTLPNNAVVKPCPAAEFARLTSELPPPERWEQIDLATLTVGGTAILGKTPGQVEAALGAPATTRPNAQRSNGVPIPEFRYGGTLPSTMGLSIRFIKRGDRIVANNLFFQSPSLVDRRLGHILRLQPPALQRAIAHSYRSRYRLFVSYGSNPTFGCGGTFRDQTSPGGIGFALNVYRPSRPYLTIDANGGG